MNEELLALLPKEAKEIDYTEMEKQQNGFFFCKWPNGKLQQFAYYKDGKQKVYLGLDERHEGASFYYETFGQIWQEGKVLQMNAWSDNEDGIPTDMSLKEWCILGIKEIIAFPNKKE